MGKECGFVGCGHILLCSLKYTSFIYSRLNTRLFIRDKRIMINKNLCHSLLLYFSQWHCSEQVVAQRNFNEFC